MAVVREGISYFTKGEHLSWLKHPSLVVNPTEKIKAMRVDRLIPSGRTLITQGKSK